MRFAHPQVLWMIVLLPLLALLVWGRLRAGRQALRRALSRPMLERLTGHLSPGRTLSRHLLLVFGCLFLILAVARPQRGTQYVTAARLGIDIIIALDVSESMLAEDLKPNRLRRARHEISAVLDRLKGDRVGLIAFAGAAFVQCPLTLDYAAARMFLEFMGPDLLPEPGTDIAAALVTATGAFDQESEGFRALILITDGEDHEGKLKDAAKTAREAGIRIFTVGIGSESGEPIPERDDAGNITGYKKDREGKVVLTRLNERGLRDVAEETGGMYVRAIGTLGLDRVVSAIDAMQKKELEGGIRVLYEERYSYFVWPVLVLLLAQWWLPLRRRRGRAMPPAGVVALLFVAAGLVGVGAPSAQVAASEGQPAAPAFPEEPPEKVLDDEEWARALEENQVQRARKPEDARPLYNLGNLYHMKGDLEEAEGFYNVATDRAEESLASCAEYNLGNTLFKQGKPKEARDAYARALWRDPENEDAKLNLELAQRVLDQMSQQPDSSAQQQQDQQDQQQDQQDQQDQQQDQQDQQDQQQDQQDEQDPQQDEQDQPDQQEQEEQQDEDSEQPQPSQPDSATTTEELQLMQILKALEASERELLKKRFQARSKNLRVEKDW